MAIPITTRTPRTITEERLAELEAKEAILEKAEQFIAHLDLRYNPSQFASTQGLFNEYQAARMRYEVLGDLPPRPARPFGEQG